MTSTPNQDDAVLNTLTTFLAGADLAGRTVAPEEDLLTSGALDSLSIALVISFVEEKFAITVPVEDVVPENFGSTAAMAGYIAAQNGNRDTTC